VTETYIVADADIDLTSSGTETVTMEASLFPQPCRLLGLPTEVKLHIVEFVSSGQQLPGNSPNWLTSY
jgi:hypothetical protein